MISYCEVSLAVAGGKITDIPTYRVRSHFKSQRGTILNFRVLDPRTRKRLAVEGDALNICGWEGRFCAYAQFGGRRGGVQYDVLFKPSALIDRYAGSFLALGPTITVLSLMSIAEKWGEEIR